MPVYRDAASNDLRDTSTGRSSDLRRIRERETELKRQRGEISCAECRRLKLKCDKKVPCFQCARRGCEGICPNGSLSGGQGTRFVLADTDKLHQKLAEMSRRIRQLEDALQVEYGSRTTESHPLLSEELLAVKSGIDYRVRGQVGDVDGEDVDFKADLTDEACSGAMGLLTISEGGAVRFLGATGYEQALLENSMMNEEEQLDGSAASLLPEQIAQTGQMWPFTPLYAPREELRKMIEVQLPTWERASALTEAYLENLSWFFRPVDRQQIVEELLPAVYKRRRSNLSPMERDPDEVVDLHDLALTLVVFACGAAGDLTLTPYNSEAETYRQLARATLGLKNIFDGASLSAVQAVCMLGMFDIVSGRHNTLETAWKMLCLGFSLSASIGLHRDPARWGLSTKLIERHRRVFWDVYMIDHFKSLASGRPTTFSAEAIDCEFPEDKEATMAEDGTILPSVWRWKHRYSKEVLAFVTSRLCAAQPLKYSGILDLDRRVREFDSHPFLRESGPTSLERGSHVRMQRLAITMFKEIVSLYIHRNFFARALLDFPTNPLRSPFAPSFLAAYRSATQLLKTLRENFDAFSYLFIRLWPIWAHALAASVIVGSVVSSGPSTTLASSAFIELEMAITLFAKATVHPVVKQGLPILLRIRNNAQQALYEDRAKGKSVAAADPSGVPSLKTEVDLHDDLAILRGTTRYLHKGGRGDPSTSTSGSSASNTSSPSSQAMGGDFSTNASNMPSSMAPDMTGAAFSADPLLQREYGGAENALAFTSMAQSTAFSNPDSRPKYNIPGLGELGSEPSPFAPQSQVQHQPLAGSASAPSNAVDAQFNGSTMQQDTSIQELASLMSSSNGQSEAELQEILSQLQNFDPMPAYGQEIPSYNPGEFWGSNFPEGQFLQTEGESSQSGEAWRSYLNDNGIAPIVMSDWNGGVRFS